MNFINYFNIKEQENFQISKSVVECTLGVAGEGATDLT